MMLHLLVIFGLGQVAWMAPSEVTPEYLDYLRATKQDEKFAKAMGISDVSLVRASEDLRSENYGVSELGDILLTPEQREQARQGINFQRYPGNKWSTKMIPYSISTTDFNTTQRAFIEAAITALNTSLTNLKLRQYRSGDADYVMVFSGNGCYSNLGRIAGGQTLSLQANGCLSTGTIQHEFIHAAGMVHEHARPDRDTYVKVLYENIPTDWRPQYDKVSSTDFGIQGAYDYYSVMHYPMTAPVTGKPAFQILQAGVQQQLIGQRNGATQTDIRKVNVLYQ